MILAIFILERRSKQPYLFPTTDSGRLTCNRIFGTAIPFFLAILDKISSASARRPRIISQRADSGTILWYSNNITFSKLSQLMAHFLTTKICLVILLSGFYSFPCKLVIRIWCKIKIKTFTWLVWVFSLPACWIMSGYYREKLHVNHLWDLKLHLTSTLLKKLFSDFNMWYKSHRILIDFFKVQAWINSRDYPKIFAFPWPNEWDHK